MAGTELYTKERPAIPSLGVRGRVSQPPRRTRNGRRPPCVYCSRPRAASSPCPALPVACIPRGSDGFRSTLEEER